MADIDVQRKTYPVWVWWLLGLVILAVLVTWLLTGVGRQEVAMLDDPPVTEPLPAPVTPFEVIAPEAVQRFHERCAQPVAAAIEPEARFAGECLQQLVDGLDAALPRDQLAPHQAALDAGRQAAAALMAATPDRPENGQLARDGFTAIAAVFERLQQEYPPIAMPARQLNQAAMTIDVAIPLTQQRDRLQQYFDQAGDILELLGRT